MNPPSVHDLTRLETGFRIESGRMARLDAQLDAALQTARELPARNGFPGELSATWHQHWDRVKGILRGIRDLLTGMDEIVASGGDDRLPRAMEAWKAIQAQDVELSKEMDLIKMEANRLQADARQDWIALDAEITKHLETIHAGALALRVKLELMKDYTGAEVNHLLAGMLAKLPNRANANTIDAEAYVQQYRQSLQDLDEERHKFGGFMDFIKGLAMWTETPDERMGKKNIPPPV